MRRIIGHLLVVGVLSTCAGVAAAGPSSAMPRDPCMDEINWWSKLSQLTQEAEHAYSDYVLWEDANVYTDLAGNQRYYVTLDNGQIVDSDDFNALHTHQAVTYNTWQSASGAALDFYNNQAMC